MEIKKLGILGFGQMGAGIGQVFAQAGYEVVAVDTKEAMLAEGPQGHREAAPGAGGKRETHGSRQGGHHGEDQDGHPSF